MPEVGRPTLVKIPSLAYRVFCRVKSKDNTYAHCILSNTNLLSFGFRTTTLDHLPSPSSMPHGEYHPNHHRAIFVVAALVVAGLCTLKPQGIFRDYDRKEKQRQLERVRDVDERKSRWNRDDEDQSSEEDEPLPSREARTPSSRGGRTTTTTTTTQARDFQDSQHPSRYRDQSPEKKKTKNKSKDPFSWEEIIMGLG
ncbi:hypothetical protein AAFC00_004468 [Neodothiora populina]|uniref:Uncharacterized protein n=1 Tax=Neodothiora populina TaxID=2781224 RepID=A0ABR3P2B3_9PEZI